MYRMNRNEEKDREKGIQNREKSCEQIERGIVDRDRRNGDKEKDWEIEGLEIERRISMMMMKVCMMKDREFAGRERRTEVGE